MPANSESFVNDIVFEPATYSDAVNSSDEEISETNNFDKCRVEHNYKSQKLATFESSPNTKDHKDFFKKSLELLLKNAVFEGTNRRNKVLEFQSPGQLKKQFDFDVGRLPTTHENLLRLLEDTIKYSVKTGHPYFANQLFSSLDPYGLVGQWLTDALNPSVYTYEVSPVFTLMEEVVLREMRKFVGFKDGNGDGIFCPGGSMANGYAINCARFKFMPDIKLNGYLSRSPLVIFTSEDAHYSIQKMASFLGIGSKNVYLIKTDGRGKMLMRHLRQEIERARNEGAQPFMVSATAGTTVLGAFDPINEIADICQEYSLWMHVDAAWGGGALVSRKYRHLLNGIERADSVTWNPHKLLSAPQQCSTLLLKHEGLLSAAHATNAAYLFQKDKFYDTSYDTGDKHVQCGRRADVLKFWFMWKAKGSEGLEKHMNKVFEKSKFFLRSIKNRPGFELLLDEPECTNICFWYVPPSLRGCRNDTNFKDKLHAVAPKMKEKMMKEGSMMVTYQAIKEHPNFFRIVFQNSSLEDSDMIHFIEKFEEYGQEL